MKKHVLVSLILVFSLCCLAACGGKQSESSSDTTPAQKETTQVPKTSASETSASAQTEPAPETSALPDTPFGKAAAGGQLLSETELKEWEAFFAPRVFSYLLISSYKEPAEIDLFELLQNGIFTADSELPLSPAMDGKETALLKERYPETKNYPGPISKLPVKEINTLLEQYLGIQLEQTEKKGLDRFMVLSEYDSYYTKPEGGHNAVQLIEAAKMPDGRMLFHWEIADNSEPNPTNHNGIVCLEQESGRWLIRSNERLE